MVHQRHATRAQIKNNLQGQGKGAGHLQLVWLSICITLLLAYTKHAPRGMKYSDPTGMIILERYADAFVDDTTLGFNDEPKEPMDIVTMLETLTKCAQLWGKNLPRKPVQ